MEVVRRAAGGHWPLDLEALVHVEFASFVVFPSLSLSLSSLCLLFGLVLLLLLPTSLVVTSADYQLQLYICCKAFGLCRRPEL